MDRIKNKNKGSDRSVKTKVKSNGNKENPKVKRINDKKIEKSKKDKYCANSSQTVLKDFKTSATRSLNSVRNTFDNLSQRLKLSSLQTNQITNNPNDCQNYRQLNGDRTPVQLYSPFGIESPSPGIDRQHLKRTCCRQMFFSPTAKIREDVLYLNNGIKELNLISENIENRFSASNSSLDLLSDNLSLI